MSLKVTVNGKRTHRWRVTVFVQYDDRDATTIVREGRKSDIDSFMDDNEGMIDEVFGGVEDNREHVTCVQITVERLT